MMRAATRAFPGPQSSQNRHRSSSCRQTTSSLRRCGGQRRSRHRAARPGRRLAEVGPAAPGPSVSARHSATPWYSGVA